MFSPEVQCQRCFARLGSEALWRVEAGDEVLATYRCPRCGTEQSLPVNSAPTARAARLVRTPVSRSDVATVQEILRTYRGDLKSLLHRPPQHRKR